MRLALLSPLPPDPSRLAHHAAQFRRALNLGGIDVLTPLVGQRPLESLEAARAWVAERDWRGVDVVHAELAPGQRTVYWVLQALARLPHGPALTATVHAPPGLLGQPLHAPFAGVYHARWLPRLTRQASAWLAAPFTRHSARRAFWGTPLMTLGVVARIHWHALRLFLKRVPFFHKPAAPERFVSR